MIKKSSSKTSSIVKTGVSSKNVQSKTDVLITILLPLVVVISVLLLNFAFTFHMDSDPFWSLAVGEWIHSQRTVPYVDVFSWTVAGEQWFSNSWLFCWLMYLADQSMGYLGIALIIFIPYLVTGYFLYFICRKYHNYNFAILISVASIFALTYTTVTPRAYIFTFPFIAIIMYLIRFKLESRLIYTIPIIMLLWTNMQSSFRFGFGIIFIEALVGTIFYKDKRLWPVVGLSFLATLINPYGFSFWNISFAEFLTPGAPYTQYIMEWRAPDFNDFSMLTLYSFVFLIALLASSRLKDDIDNKVFDRNKIMILFWFWAALLYSFTTVRALQYVMLLLGPCFAAFATKSTGESRYLKPVTLAMVLLLFLFSLTTSLPLLPLETEPQSRKPVSFVDYLQATPAFSNRISLIMPSGAVAYFKENPTKLDRLFNVYEMGGYLLLNNIEVFIDSRGDVFTRHNVTKDSSQIRELRVNPELVIEKYDIKTFLLYKPEPLVLYLDLHPEWEEKYADEITVIFTRINSD